MTANNAQRAPIFTYTKVQARAVQVLQEHHPSFDLPIPIEDIIDVATGLHIWPFPNLYRDFRLNGFLLKARHTILVDEYQCSTYDHKYRFTIAHEFGHYLLHSNFYSDEVSSIEEAITTRLQLPDDAIGWMENHANWFAGCLLVPQQPLERECYRIALETRGQVSEEMWLSDNFWEYAAKPLEGIFKVSPITIVTQIRKDKIAGVIRARVQDSSG